MKEVEIRLDKPGSQIIGDILSVAKMKNQMGPVAQHLVGAKLALRYSHLEIENHSYTTAAAPTGREGDFLVGDTVFHVTVAPMPPVIDKCEANIRNGYRAILLVPEVQVPAGRAMAENLGLRNKIDVRSLECFIGQTIEELSEFGQANLATQFRLLIEKYNEWVDAVETDRSLLIDLPENL